MRTSGRNRLALAILGVLAGCVLVAPAAAYVLGLPGDASTRRPAWPGPKVTYQAKAYKAEVRRAVRAFNRLRVGVRVVSTRKGATPDIRFTYGGSGCRRHLGMTVRRRPTQGRTQATVTLARGCTSRRAFMAAAHELGHALGLKHEDRRCSLMNSYLIGTDAVPSRCSADNDWMRQPFRRDDYYGLRRLWRNTPPRAAIVSPTRAPRVGVPVRFADVSTDAQDNITRATWHFGEASGSSNVVVRRSPTGGSEAQASDPGLVEHVYTRPGPYTVTLWVRDSYGRVSRAAASFTVGSAPRRPAPR